MIVSEANETFTHEPEARTPDVGLERARAMEHTSGLVRSVHAHLEHGPYKGTRRRLRKQLDKLAAVLDEAQRNVLAGPGRDLDDAVDVALASLDERLEHTLYHDVAKEDLEQLRVLVKRQRQLVAELTKIPASEAA